MPKSTTGIIGKYRKLKFDEPRPDPKDSEVFKELNSSSVNLEEKRTDLVSDISEHELQEISPFVSPGDTSLDYYKQMYQTAFLKYEFYENVLRTETYQFLPEFKDGTTDLDTLNSLKALHGRRMIEALTRIEDLKHLGRSVQHHDF